MALSEEEERKERARLSQYRYNQSEKGKARNKRYEQTANSKAYRKKYREENSEYFKNYQEKYQQTDKYRESIKKYQSSDKYRETVKRYEERKREQKNFHTEFIDDGKNNTTTRAYKARKKDNYDMIDFTDDFINELCDEWLEWLESATYTNDSSCVVFRKEIPRTTYFQFFNYYKQKFNKRISVWDLEREYQTNQLLRERMAEIDLIYEQLLEMYMTNGKINAVSAKFMFTNKYKDKWSDVKKNVNETTIERITWNETLWVDAQVVEPQQLNSKSSSKKDDEDFDFFEDL